LRFRMLLNNRTRDKRKSSSCEEWWPRPSGTGRGRGESRGRAPAGTRAAPIVQNPAQNKPRFKLAKLYALICGRPIPRASCQSCIAFNREPNPPSGYHVNLVREFALYEFETGAAYGHFAPHGSFILWAFFLGHWAVNSSIQSMILPSPPRVSMRPTTR